MEKCFSETEHMHLFLNEIPKQKRKVEKTVYEAANKQLGQCKEKERWKRV